MTDLALERARERIALGDARGALDALAGQLVHLNAHEPEGPGCLCPACFGALALEHAGERFALDLVAARGRALFYWLPLELADDRAAVRDRVARRLDQLLEKPRRYEARDLTVTPWRLRTGR